MTIVRVKGFQIFKDRHGKWRCYHRKTKTPIDLQQYPIGTAGFFAQCVRVAEIAKLAGSSKAGTLGHLMKDFRASPAFAGLAPRTQADYSRVMDYLLPIADTPLSRFDPPLVVAIRDKAGERGRRWGNYVKAVLSVIFTWGVERGRLPKNPVTGVKNIRRPKGQPDANRPWMDYERHVVLDEAPAHMRPALALMMYTGIAPGDALKLPRNFYRDGSIATRRSKTGVPVYWPAPAPLKEALDNAPAHDALTICANSYGTPWTGSGFRASWRTYRDKLRAEGKIQDGLTLYGLRHTVAVILREIGYDERSIADALGQKTIEMARLYAKGADLTKKMTDVAQNFDREVNRRRTEVSNPAFEVSNPTKAVST